MNENVSLYYRNIQESFRIDIERVKRSDEFINYLWDLNFSEVFDKPFQYNEVHKAQLLSTHHQLIIVYLCSRFEDLLKTGHIIYYYLNPDEMHKLNERLHDWEVIQRYCDKKKRSAGSIIKYMHLLEDLWEMSIINPLNKEDKETQLDEIYQYRHVFLHQSNYIDRQYQERTNSKENIIGMAYPINEDYIEESIFLIEETGNAYLNKIGQRLR